MRTNNSKLNLACYFHHTISKVSHLECVHCLLRLLVLTSREDRIYLGELERAQTTKGNTEKSETSKYPQYDSISCISRLEVRYRKLTSSTVAKWKMWTMDDAIDGSNNNNCTTKQSSVVVLAMQDVVVGDVRQTRFLIFVHGNFLFFFFFWTSCEDLIVVLLFCIDLSQTI